MIDITDLVTIHIATLKSVKNFGLNIADFETVDALKSELTRLRTLKLNARLKRDMGQKYKNDPEKYRTMRQENRMKQKEKDPDYNKKKADYNRQLYAKNKKKKVHNVEDIAKLLELPIPVIENEYEIVD